MTLFGHPVRFDCFKEEVAASPTKVAIIAPRDQHCSRGS